MANWKQDFLERSDLSRHSFNHKRHGLIFNMPDGSRTAVLQIKPVNLHDKERGWYGIDTSLISEGGSYGAKGLKPRILPTGEVQFLEIGYRQKTLGVGVFNPTTLEYTEVIDLFRTANGLVGSGVDSDKLIRDVGDYSYRWILKERGLKDELIINSKPTNLSEELFVIQAEVFSKNFPDGNLSGNQDLGEGWTMDGGYAYDATGVQIPLTRYAKQIGGPRSYIYYGVPTAWLDDPTRLYPVILDPTYQEQPDSADGRDTYLKQGANANVNYGTSTIIRLGEEGSGRIGRGLIKFDLSSLPVGATLTSATLEFWQNSSTGGTPTLDFHRVLRDWVELEATWNIWSTGNSWTSSGADSSGNDIASSASFSKITQNINGVAIVINEAGLLTDLQDWVDGVNTNYGHRIADTTNTVNQDRQLRTSDHSTPSERPELTIEYEALDVGGGPMWFDGSF